ncbi:MAG TPA: hypothetical protein VGG05_04030 [Pseudonocardiaceae bacterium]|jgi:hypothetical protein
MTTLADRLRSLYTLDDRTVESGRYVSTTLLIDAGAERALVTIDAGRVTSVTDAASRVMPGWQFALRAPADEWEAFWAATPRPGSHDLFALLRRKQLRVEGDLHPFMSNLLYFKALLALPRAA